jgi:hypothetical protein
MIGLMILLVAGIYLAVWVAIVIFSYNKTLKATQSKKQAFAISAFFFLVMYMIPFWDLIPTLIAHKYYCNTEAGFWIYKTPQEWIAENPGDIENLKMSLKPHNLTIKMNNTVRTGVTQRFYHDVKREKIFLTLGRTEKKFIDAETGELIAKTVNFILGSGKASVVSGGSIESWRRAFSFFPFGKGQCGIYEKNSRNGVFSAEDNFSEFIYQFWKHGEDK